MMRIPSQVPFDATVRISLDTNLTMIKENPDDGPSCTVAGRCGPCHDCALAQDFTRMSSCMGKIPGNLGSALVPGSRWHPLLRAAHPLRACLMCLGRQSRAPRACGGAGGTATRCCPSRAGRSRASRTACWR